MKQQNISFTKILSSLVVSIFITGCMAQQSGSQSSGALRPQVQQAQAAPAAQQKAPSRRGSNYTELVELTDDFCKDLAKEIGAGRIYLDRNNIKDLSSGDGANFSDYLEQEIDSSCSKKGLPIVYDVTEADYMIGVLYRRYSSDVRVFFKYHPVDMSTKNSLDYQIAERVLPDDSFRNSMKYKVKKLAREVARGADGKKLYVKPVVEGKKLYVSDFSKSFTSRLKSEIVREYRDVIVIDYSATRGIGVGKKSGVSLDKADVASTGADLVLAGQYFPDGDIVSIQLFLKQLDNSRLLNSAEIDIARQDISAEIEDDQMDYIATVVDKKDEIFQSTVKLSTTKGSDYPIYKNGERITFTIQASDPLYVYLYDFNPRGELVALYPNDYMGREKPIVPGEVYTIPEKGANWELFAEPPFGRDGVKLFASPRPIPMPVISLQNNSFQTRAIGIRRKDQQNQIATTSRITHPNDLVDYFRGKARQMRVPLYEDSLMIETVP